VKGSPKPPYLTTPLSFSLQAGVSWSELTFFLPRRIQDDFWEQAASELSKDDKEILKVMRLNKSSNPKEILDKVEEKNKTIKERQWKFKQKNGDVIIFRDIFEKVVRCLKKFESVGDTIISYDVSGHAALPWAGVKIMLGVSTIGPI
jgi:hypothetical protein